MKTTTSNRLRLGIFVSLGIVLFIVGVYFIGERQQLFRSTFHLSGVFRDVSGLQAGNNVRLAGINVGSVENISCSFGGMQGQSNGIIEWMACQTKNKGNPADCLC